VWSAVGKATLGIFNYFCNELSIVNDSVILSWAK
jgi:hypothetical protein